MGGAFPLIPLRTIITPLFLPPPERSDLVARAQLINPSSQTVSGAKLRRYLQLVDTILIENTHLSLVNLRPNINT